MSKWTMHAAWSGPIVMIGFGSIGRGSLPLILRHIKCQPSQVTVIDPDATWKHLAVRQGVNFVQQGLTPKNYTQVLTPLLTAGPTPAFIVNLSVDVDSVDIMKLARKHGALCLDTVIEPWAGFYFNSKVDNAARTNYALRERMLAVKRDLGAGPTAVSCSGANPGMVSWLVKAGDAEYCR